MLPISNPQLFAISQFNLLPPFAHTVLPAQKDRFRNLLRYSLAEKLCVNGEYSKGLSIFLRSLLEMQERLNLPRPVQTKAMGQLLHSPPENPKLCEVGIENDWIFQRLKGSEGAEWLNKGDYSQGLELLIEDVLNLLRRVSNMKKEDLKKLA